MLTTQKPAAAHAAMGALIVALLVATGCGPPGPRALLKGERLIRQQKFPEAITSLTEATRILTNSAPAWNLLGLAYHYAGDPDRAASAYGRALELDRDFAIARFNLGCLNLETTNLNAALNEFNAYAALRPNSVDGLLKLAETQRRARQYDAAEQNFRAVSFLQASNAQALNGLGLILVDRRRPAEALDRFLSAARLNTNYAPALLNAAIVSHLYLSRTSHAAQLYREYAARFPNTPAAASASQIVQRIDPPARLTAQATPGKTPASPPSAQTNAAPDRRNATTTSALTGRTNPAASSIPKPQPSASAQNARAATPNPVPATTTKPSVPQPPPTSTQPATTATSAPPPVVTVPAVPRQPSNPPPSTVVQTAPPASPAPAPAPSATTSPSPPIRDATRYDYRKAGAPTPGDRSQAEGLVKEGLQAQQQNRPGQALELYRRAAEADPSLFEAQYNLGVLAFAANQLAEALTAYETAVNLQPTSLRARYNFGVALLRAGYPRDAAGELEHAAEISPNELRVHQTLANLYARDLKDRQKARQHYLKVLQLDPQHPDATAIRYWLEANP